MDKKNNMKQAMYEMFGVGSETEAAGEGVEKKETANAAAAQNAKREQEKNRFGFAPAAPKTAVSYLAPGTIMEGTLRSSGDVEVAGIFKGDITTDGVVILRSDVQGNIAASSVNLSGSNLVGDIVSGDTITISRDSTVCGNVTAKELKCAGKVTGDLKISGNTVLEETAQVTGNMVTGGVSVAIGAVIKGGVEVKAVAPSEG